VVGTTIPNVTQFLDTGLTDATKYYYRITALSLAGPSATTATVNATTKTIAATGVSAQYWNDPNGTNPNFHNGDGGDSPALTRTDANIAVDWGTGSPDTNLVQTDNFSSQWDGTYIADYTGPTTFLTSTDDGGRLWIDLNGDGGFQWDPSVAGTLTPNQELIVNSWVDQGPGLDGVVNGRGVVVNLVAGKSYLIRMRQFEHGGGAAAFLRIQTPVTNGVVTVPTESLIPTPNTLKVIGSPEIDRPLPSTAVYTPKQHIVVRLNNKANATVDPSNITITQIGGAGTVYGGAGNPTQLLWTYDTNSGAGVITFPGIPNETLPDGNYRLTLTAAGITGLDGAQLDGNADGTPGGDYNFNFYIFKGDTQVGYDGNYTGDKKIDFVDLQIVEAHLGQDQVQRVSAADGDFNHDGVVDITDLTFVRKNINKTLPAAPVSAPTPTPVASKPAPKPAPKPVAKPAPAPKPVVAPTPKSVFATKKISSVKDLLK